MAVHGATFEPLKLQSFSNEPSTMNPQIQSSLQSTALLVSLTYVPLLLSVLSFYRELFAAHPVQHFFLALAPWWLAYLSARWYVRLAEQSSPLYHPLGCFAQCCVWVFHWAVSVYHAFFGRYLTVSAELACQACCLLSSHKVHRVDISNHRILRGRRGHRRGAVPQPCRDGFLGPSPPRCLRKDAKTLWTR